MAPPTLNAALSTLHDRLGQIFDALPNDLTERQAALLLLAEQPSGGLAIFRLGDGPSAREATIEQVLRDSAPSICPELVRGFERVAPQGGPTRSRVWRPRLCWIVGSALRTSVRCLCWCR